MAAGARCNGYCRCQSQYLGGGWLIAITTFAFHIIWLGQKIIMYSFPDVFLYNSFKIKFQRLFDIKKLACVILSIDASKMPILLECKITPRTFQRKSQVKVYIKTSNLLPMLHPSHLDIQGWSRSYLTAKRLQMSRHFLMRPATLHIARLLLKFEFQE